MLRGAFAIIAAPRVEGRIREGVAMDPVSKLNQLSSSHGELRSGKGMVSGVIALILAVLVFLGVLVFHFPEYLSTPQLRKQYSVDFMRQLL